MAQAHPKPVWHLSRGDEAPCVLSDQELLLLAELGHLRADDLLWRPGFDGWRTVRSLLGHVTAPPLPSSISLSERPKQIGAKATPLLSRYQKKSGSPGLIESTAFLGRVERPRNLAGLLVATVLVGVLGFAMHKSFATDTQPALQYSASTEPHSASTEPHSASTEPQQPKSEPAIANAVQSTGQAELEGDIIVHTVRVVSIDKLQPSDASVLVRNPVSDEPSTSVPLPTKKPVRPIQRLNTAEGARASAAAPGRMPQTPVPKPQRFGSFGFNYLEN
jgi:hypothetical protein